MRSRKKLSAIGFIVLLSAVFVFFSVRGKGSAVKSENLALMKGVKASSDSVETEALSADKAIDGDDETLSSRWSSENNWDDASHYIELEFPEEISVSFVVLKWERTNATAYSLESSLDGEDWKALKEFDQAPALRKQEIALDEAVTLKFIRVSTSEVSQNVEDHSNLYQNVSLYEFEVYAEKPASYYVDEPTVRINDDGSRELVMPKAPEGYKLTFLGADYEQIIGNDREIYETIQDREVTVGFSIEKEDYDDNSKAVGNGGDSRRELSFTVNVPAYDNGGESYDGAVNEAPQVIPAVAEWKGRIGSFEAGEDSRIIIEDGSLRQTAELFAESIREIMGYGEAPDICMSDGTATTGDFYLGYASDKTAAGLGEEGYVCDINDTCVINAPEAKGIYWGAVTVMQILKTNGGRLPCGMIRDYPKYKVRGFGIDVARKPVSMAMLYRIMENMSWYKMNDLSIHLNDNEILSAGEDAASFEEALKAYSAFRIDTSVINKNGEKLTSDDYYYTAEEFANFIEDAKKYGINVVPEIDTPAHSLSITKLFPEYALKTGGESADQIDLDKKEAVELVKNIWKELLSGESISDGEISSGGNGAKAAFAQAEIVNIGMDEYYGDGEEYRRYMNEIIDFVKQESGASGEENGIRTVRVWGSLSNMDGKTLPDTEGLQMNIWSRVWARPLEMYEEGYTLINMQNNHLYIIAGGGYDRLDAKELYENWEPNKFYDDSDTEYVPSYSPQMAGAAYMIWNDMSGRLDVGISETDLFDRFFEPLGVISGKLWGEAGGVSLREEREEYEGYEKLYESIGVAALSNPYALKEWDGEKLEFTGLYNYSSESCADGEKDAILLSGGSSYVNTGYKGGNGNGYGIGGSYSVSFDIYRQGGATQDPDSPLYKNDIDNTEQILFETDPAYGQRAFKAVQSESGKVGFSEEGRDYSFDYVLPENEWINLTIRGEKNKTSLYVNGELVDTLGDDEPFREYATFVFPLERIGSRSHGFCGIIKNIAVSAG